LKKIIILIINIFISSLIFAQQITEQSNTTNIQTKKKLYIQTGALESFNANKYILRKISSKIEFFINDSTVILLKSPGSYSDLKEKCYIVVKGPHNKKTILANSVYIYNNKEEYALFSDENKTSDTPIKFSFLLEGYVKQLEPLIINTADMKDYIVSYDEDTNFIINKIGNKDNIKIGDSLTLFFDKIISIRYDNYPIKIIINKMRSVE
jgi:hypothetical protein